MAKEQKTNAMRILDKSKVPYRVATYPCEEFIDGNHMADALGIPRESTFKTLVAVGKSGGHYVFVLPVAEEIDRKAAARTVGEKGVELIPVKELFPLTGYIRGGCTAIGMKKNFPTVLHQTALDFDTVAVSAGRVGETLFLSPADFIRVTGAKTADIVFHGESL